MAEEKKGFVAEFKEFIAQGNVMNLAVGIIIGTAFTAIVNSLVGDIIMPIVGAIMGGVDFSSLAITVGEGDHAANIGYGAFIQAIIDFLLIALVVFWIVKAYNKAQAPEEDPDAPTCPFCKEEVKEGATRCPHCAGEFDAPAEAPAA